MGPKMAWLAAVIFIYANFMSSALTKTATSDVRVVFIVFLTG